MGPFMELQSDARASSTADKIYDLYDFMTPLIHRNEPFFHVVCRRLTLSIFLVIVTLTPFLYFL